MNVQLSTVDQIVELFYLGAHVRQASSGIAEPVDLVEHGLQCAELLASWFPEDIELQVAGLLHDLGHHLNIAGSPGCGISNLTELDCSTCVASSR
jgi:predicted HD phosphohydrolase